MQLAPDPDLVARFAADLDRLVPAGLGVGLAVSGGPDSMALLLLAAAARPGKVEAATVNHALRPESAEEAAQVAALCERLGVPHSILTVQWDAPPEAAVQERARAERYRLLGGWLGERGLAALATAHHLDDQAETLLMRLSRGAGVRGLAAIRPLSRVPGSGHALVRPLLGWSRAELGALCEASGVTPVDDPSNADDAFERIRFRKALAEADWLDPKALAVSAANLASADVALDWAAAREWERSVSQREQQIDYRPGQSPHEIRRRIVGRAIATLASEGDAGFRGLELERILEVLRTGGTGTLRGVQCSGGDSWTFAPAAPRQLH